MLAVQAFNSRKALNHCRFVWPGGKAPCHKGAMLSYSF